MDYPMTIKSFMLLGLGAFAAVSAVPSFANETTTTAKDPDQAIKCRKVEVTGSLVKKGRVCKTIAEWKKIQADGNRTARMIGETGGICSGGDCGRGN
jgi:hypothetical protein